MKDEILLSPKYGLNPTIPVCFYCGKHKNEIALLGKIGGKKEDLKAPREILLDYEPCEECKKLVGDGVFVVRVSDAPVRRGQPEIGKGLWPTGRWCGLKREAAVRIFGLDESKKDRLILVDEDVFDQLWKMKRE